MKISCFQDGSIFSQISTHSSGHLISSALWTGAFRSTASSLLLGSCCFTTGLLLDLVGCRCLWGLLPGPRALGGLQGQNPAFGSQPGSVCSGSDHSLLSPLLNSFALCCQEPVFLLRCFWQFVRQVAHEPLREQNRISWQVFLQQWLCSLCFHQRPERQRVFLVV